MEAEQVAGLTVVLPARSFHGLTKKNKTKPSYTTSVLKPLTGSMFPEYPRTYFPSVLSLMQRATSLDLRIGYAVLCNVFWIAMTILAEFPIPQ